MGEEMILIQIFWIVLYAIGDLFKNKNKTYGLGKTATVKRYARESGLKMITLEVSKYRAESQDFIGFTKE
ncbi:hypothetical protein N9948_02030 [bacterium]|nr:hypothetical protein [bacterium]